MEEGFIEAHSYNLPKVSVDMVVRFFAASTDIKASKCSVRESYGDSTIRFVQIKRNGGSCTVKSRVMSEHGIKSDYRTTVVIDEDEDLVTSCQCEDCVACPDACRHAVAFLLWLHRRSEEPAATHTTCYWKPSPLPDHEDTKPFMTIKQMLGIENVKTETDTSIFEEFMKVAKERNIDCALTRHLRDEKQALGLHWLCARLRGELHCARALLHALVAEMTAVTETDATPWHEIWYGRIKDSMLHEAVNRPDLKNNLVDRILGEDLEYTPDEIAKRKLIKEAVLKEVGKKEKIKIKEGGLLLNAEYPILGAAPDGVADDYTVEIKWPSNEETLLSYVKDNKLAMELWTQVQAQMYFSRKRCALFCVALPDFETSRAVEIFHVPYDESIVGVLDKAQQFWIDAIFPELMRIYNN